MSLQPSEIWCATHQRNVFKCINDPKADHGNCKITQQPLLVTSPALVHPVVVAETIIRLERLLKILRDHGATALDNAESWQNTFPRPATVLVDDERGDAVSVELTAVENAATRRPQLVDTAYWRMRETIAQVDALSAQLANDVIRNRRLTPQEARKLFAAEHDVQVVICESDTCTDIATHDNTHCDACHDYLLAHEGIRVVPRDTIATRMRVRKYRETTRGTHVDGPLAEMEAM